MAERTLMARLICYRAKDGWRWHLISGSRIVAESGEAYTRRSSCARAVDRVQSVFTAGVFNVIWHPARRVLARRGR